MAGSADRSRIARRATVAPRPTIRYCSLLTTRGGSDNAVTVRRTDQGSVCMPECEFEAILATPPRKAERAHLSIWGREAAHDVRDFRWPVECMRLMQLWARVATQDRRQPLPVLPGPARRASIQSGGLISGVDRGPYLEADSRLRRRSTRPVRTNPAQQRSQGNPCHEP